MKGGADRHAGRTLGELFGQIVNREEAVDGSCVQGASLPDAFRLNRSGQSSVPRESIVQERLVVRDLLRFYFLARVSDVVWGFEESSFIHCLAAPPNSSATY